MPQPASALAGKHASRPKVSLTSDRIKQCTGAAARPSARPGYARPGKASASGSSRMVSKAHADCNGQICMGRGGARFFPCRHHQPGREYGDEVHNRRSSARRECHDRPHGSAGSKRGQQPQIRHPFPERPGSSEFLVGYKAEADKHRQRNTPAVDTAQAASAGSSQPMAKYRPNATTAGSKPEYSRSPWPFARQIRNRKLARPSWPDGAVAGRHRIVHAAMFRPKMGRLCSAPTQDGSAM